MAKLSAEEQKALDNLLSKKDAPEEPPMNKSVSFSIDLGDESQIKRAIKLGLLSGVEDEGDGDGDGDGDGNGDETPRRRGYFKEGK